MNYQTETWQKKNIDIKSPLYGEVVQKPAVGALPFQLSLKSQTLNP